MSVPGAAMAQSGRLAWTDSDPMILFYEALTQIQANALAPDPPMAVVRTFLREYLKQADPFADYLTPEEYAAFSLSATDARYSGIGMDIGGEPSGKIICIPYPGGPAEQAGVVYGDELTAVDGAAVDGQSTYQVGLNIRGAPGTPVRLTLQGRGRMPRTVAVVRARIRAKSIFTVPRGPYSVIRILKFTRNTPRELKPALAAGGRGGVQIIDLTGNMGGDLYAAVACASLLLPEGSPIVAVKTREGFKRHSAGPGPADLASRLFLWQDARTASAAEVFVAALVQNGRGVSIGRTSFGKGVAQRVVELMDRSAMILTYAELTPPSGSSFHGAGLKPLVPLPLETAGRRAADDYMEKTQHLIQQNPS
jgi:carboxyl-terminal processing protease